MFAAFQVYLQELFFINNVCFLLTCSSCFTMYDENVWLWRFLLAGFQILKVKILLYCSKYLSETSCFTDMWVYTGERWVWFLAVFLSNKMENNMMENVLPDFLLWEHSVIHKWAHMQKKCFLAFFSDQELNN